MVRLDCKAERRKVGQVVRDVAPSRASSVGGPINMIPRAERGLRRIDGVSGRVGTIHFEPTDPAIRQQARRNVGPNGRAGRAQRRGALENFSGAGSDVNDIAVARRDAPASDVFEGPRRQNRGPRFRPCDGGSSGGGRGIATSPRGLSAIPKDIGITRIHAVIDDEGEIGGAFGHLSRAIDDVGGTCSARGGTHQVFVLYFKKNRIRIAGVIADPTSIPAVEIGPCVDTASIGSHVRSVILRSTEVARSPRKRKPMIKLRDLIIVVEIRPVDLTGSVFADSIICARSGCGQRVGGFEESPVIADVERLVGSPIPTGIKRQNVIVRVDIDAWRPSFPPITDDSPIRAAVVGAKPINASGENDVFIMRRDRDGIVIPTLIQERIGSGET